VQEPEQNEAGCLALGFSCDDHDWFARLDQTAYFTAWTLDTLHIGDCEIVPVATYEIRATTDGVTFSDPLVIGTITKPGTRHYADVVGVILGDLPPLPGFTPPNGVVDQIDVDAVTLTIEGPSNPSAHATWVALHGLDPVSAPNYIINVSDVQLVLFGLNGDTYPPAGFLNPGECAQAEAGGSVGGDPALFSLTADSNSIAPDQTVVVEVFITPPAGAIIKDLGAYEVALSVTGGDGGALVLTAVTIHSDRTDYVFGSARTFNAVSVLGGRISNALASGGVSVEGPAYLGTFTYKAATEATGLFTVAVKAAGRSFLNDRNVVLLSSDPGEPESIRVTTQ